MLSDPIVREVRRVGEKLAEEAGGNVKQFFANLRAAQERYRGRLVRAVPKKEPYDSSAVSGHEASESHLNHPA
ncbi:MAG: hypothetical protein V1792_28875 [Pseudomonadota bacterium]